MKRKQAWVLGAASTAEYTNPSDGGMRFPRRKPVHETKWPAGTICASPTVPPSCKPSQNTGTTTIDKT